MNRPRTFLGFALLLAFCVDGSNIQAASWSIYYVDNGAHSVGFSCSAVVMPSGQFAVAYYDATDGDLRFVQGVDGLWNYETIESAGDVGSYTCLSVDSSSNRHVVYYDATNSGIKYAGVLGYKWQVSTEVLESGVNIYYASGDVDWRNRLAVAFYNASDRSLQYKSESSIGVWNPTGTVDSGNDVGAYCSLDISQADDRYIAYQDSANGWAKIASIAGDGPKISSIAPTFGLNTGSVNVTIRGANFQSGATALLRKPIAGTINGTGVNVVSSQEVRCIFDLTLRGLGAWDLEVANPDGHPWTYPSAFLIVAIPFAPSNLTATAVSSTQINLSWNDNSANEDGFRIERKTGATGAWSEIAVVGMNERTYQDTTLQRATTYYYQVRAYNIGGSSAYAGPTSATTRDVAPVAPSNLAATAVSSSQINLTWGDNSNNEQGFKIQRKTGTSGTWLQIATVAANVRSYQNTGLLPNTTYYYRVFAYNTAGDSPYSNTASAATPDVAPAPPSNLTAGVLSSSQINLAWNDNSNNEQGFKIERKTGASGIWSQFGTVAANVRSYQNTGLSAATLYYYRVRAYNSIGDSSYSNQASATTRDVSPVAPSNLTATAVFSSQINLAWNDNSNNEQGFKIERKTGASGSWGQIATVGANVRTFQNTGITANTTYYYRASAYNAIGNSGYSNQAMSTTPPPAGNLALYNDVPARFGNLKAVTALCADGADATALVYTMGASLDPTRFSIEVVEGDSPGQNGSVRIVSRRTGRIDARYIAPDSFCRTNHLEDANSTTRTITVRMTYNGIVCLQKQMNLYRAPVVFLHGIWSDGAAWDGVVRYFRDASRLYPADLLRAHDYRLTNAEAFQTNSNVCDWAIYFALENARDHGYSAGKVDVVAHSMGGILARAYLRNLASTTRYLNDVHKLITIGTPHSGSQAANYIMTDPGLQWILNRFGRRCDRGAVADLCVDSSAIDSWLNGTVDPNNVPSHAIVAEANVADGSVDERRIYQFIAEAEDQPVETLPPAIFRENSDLIVARSSQQGGLSTFTPYSHVSHTNEINADNNQLKMLLNASSGSTFFTSLVFRPPNLHYAPLVAPPIRSAVRPTASVSVHIATPTSGSAVAAGTTITVQVTGSGALRSVLLTAPSCVDAKSAAPFNFKVGIPKDALGVYPIAVVGFGTNDEIATDTVDLKVTTTAALLGVETFPAGRLGVAKEQTASLSVLGVFSDGTRRDITPHQLGTRYTIANPSIATVVGDGLVRGVVPGTTNLTVSNGGVGITLPVVVVGSSAILTGAGPAWSLYK